MAGATAVEPQLHRKHVVVCVDDEWPVLASLQRLLRKEPYQIFTTDKPHEALEWIEQIDVSLLITDQRMPGVPGTDLLKVIRDCSPETTRIMLTAYPDSGPVRDALHQGRVDRVVPKPWNEEDLKATILRLLRDREHTGHTTRMVRPRFEAEPSQGDLQEWMIRLDCRGRRASDLLVQLTAGARWGAAKRAGLVLALRNLPWLEDPVSTFLETLSARVAGEGISCLILDRSGIAFGWRKAAQAPESFQAPAPTDPPQRILVVDESDPPAEWLCTFFEALGNSCSRARSIPEGLLRLDGSDFDLVVLHLPAPDPGGSELAQHVVDHGKRLPVVVVTPLPDLWDPARCERFGIRRRIAQPCRARDLLDALEPVMK